MQFGQGIKLHCESPGTEPIKNNENFSKKLLCISEKIIINYKILFINKMNALS